MLRHDIHCNLAKVKVRADAARRGNPRRREHILDNRLHQLSRRFFVQLKVASQVQEALVNGIRVNILGAHILQVDVVDLRGILHVFRHLRFRNQEFNLFARTAFHLAHFLVYLEKAGATGNPVGLERRRHCEANRLLGAALVGHHKLSLQRINTPEDTFHRSKERLEVNGGIGSRLHNENIGSGG